MKRFTKHWIGWGIFVLAAGSLWHFVYEWSGETWLVGLFFPVNESTWEHMKLVFFPIAISGGFLTGRFRKEMPGILGSVCAGALVGTWAVPVLFYTYSGILGRDVMALDLLTFAFSVAAGFLVIRRMAGSDGAEKWGGWLCFLAIAQGVLFPVFTVFPPETGLFALPG